MMLYIALRIAHEIIKSQRRRKKKPLEQRHCSRGTSAVVFITASRRSGSWTNAR